MVTQQRVLKQATIAPNAIRYNLLGLVIAFSITVVGIPLLLIAIPIAKWYWSRYYANLKVVLTTRELKVHRGILNREEKSIPLEKITDLAVFDGPIMRYMNLKGIKVETAGQSSGVAALVRIVGIEDTNDFRDKVLTQRDRITDMDSSSDEPAASPTAAAGSAASVANSETLAVLQEIRDSLHRLEALQTPDSKAD